MFVLALFFRSEFWAHRRQKCYKNPFLGPFETPKEYGRHCHRYLGKVKFFGTFGSQKGAKNAIFVQGGALKAPPLMVGLNYLFVSVWHRIVPNREFWSFIFTNFVVKGHFLPFPKNVLRINLWMEIKFLRIKFFFEVHHSIHPCMSFCVLRKNG